MYKSSKLFVIYFFANTATTASRLQVYICCWRSI